MNYKPILFSGPMVRALLDGTKTQTRRVCNPQPSAGLVYLGKILCSSVPSDEGKYSFVDSIPNVRRSERIACRYGQPGSLLWVKETFADTRQAGESDPWFVYRATDPAWGEEMEGWKWKPSIFMPRSASRITLEVTRLRVERLNDISEEDAMEEGIISLGTSEWREAMANFGLPEWPNTNMAPLIKETARGAYRSLWESINGPGSWALNPWVWVIQFERI